MVAKFDPSLSGLRDESKTLFTPAFYTNFKCIGTACENNCCHHWNITMDRPTFKVFKTHSDFKVRQVAEKKTKSCGPDGVDYRQMKLEPNGNCPLLDDEGLCYVHKNHGEEILPQTCKIYPREDKLIDGELFSNLSISCPEAARKILLDPGSMTVEKTKITGKTVLPTFVNRLNVRDSGLYQRFKQVAYECLLDEKADTVEQRLFNLAALFGVSSQRVEKGGDLATLLATFERSIQSGELGEMYQTTAVDQDAQLYVLRQLLYEQRFGEGNVAFLNFKLLAMDKLKHTDAFDAQTDKVDLSDYYHKYCKKGYEKLIDSHGYTFINMMLHWVYSKPFNLSDNKAMFNEFATFALKFFYVRLLVGILNSGHDGKELTKEDCEAMLVGIIHSISRRFDHNHNISQDMYSSLLQKGMTRPEHIFGLIKV
jgi:lysine-N-methylase